MEDTISRKKAIDSICRTVCDNPEICESPCDEVKILENMPSAQPEQTNSWCINSWCNNCKEYDKAKYSCPRFNRVIKQTIDEIYSHAEIVRCKDCVKRNRKLGSLDEHYNRYNKSQCCPMIEFRGMPHGHEFDYQYCSWAERRTDG